MQYDFEYVIPEMMEGAAEGVLIGAAGIVAGVLLLVWLVAMAFSVVSYVLSAVGMYRIAKRRGIHHAWLAWIPIGSSWLLGSISDHYQYVAKQKVTKLRVILLVLGIVTAVMGGFFGLGTGLLSAAEMAGGEAAGSILAVVVMVIAYLGMMGLAITATIFCYIAYFDLFRSCDKENGTLFAVLSVVIWVLLPFLVFACRKRDGGMPPRKQPTPPLGYRPVAPVQIVQVEVPVAETPVEEIPVVEEPVKEIPVVETPVVEVPAEEPPAEELPAKPEVIAE